MQVLMTNELYRTLIEYSFSKLPEEACGFILGQVLDQDAGFTAHSFAPMRNCAANPQLQFDIAPQDMVPFLVNTENHVIGIFHSHPTASPIPSEQDLQTLWHTIPTHWILSLQAPKQPELFLYQIKKASPTAFNKLRL
ncbi:Mov34/MPN/PAD-1 family protein [Paenibacillus sp. N3.4]|uniref:Mov34/MPN/PAD-1 family protein n=1 Tax=Paenibacillus sp. N3.4 TaxID=2603222 RepID=UPI0011C940DB|nr:Mov34/MPN/PAD-1 family protein [Paenibacillus sp. N3.4]TXK86038.1 hypothetical protein FU659_00905 [Paenibacillus sp. N3.4]